MNSKQLANHLVSYIFKDVIPGSVNLLKSAADSTNNKEFNNAIRFLKELPPEDMKILMTILNLGGSITLKSTVGLFDSSSNAPNRLNTSIVDKESKEKFKHLVLEIDQEIKKVR